MLEAERGGWEKPSWSRRGLATSPLSTARGRWRPGTTEDSGARRHGGGQRDTASWLGEDKGELGEEKEEGDERWVSHASD